MRRPLRGPPGAGWAVGSPAWRTLTRLLCMLLMTVLSAGSAAGWGSLPSWYDCSCEPPGAAVGCVCPSTEPPGGLRREDVPQFVLFTNDDAVSAHTFAALQSLLAGRGSTNGCRAAATLFTLSRGTNCTLLRQLYAEGYEVASHSLTHQKMNGWGKGDVAAEVEGGRASLASACGIPQADIVGFRQPYLQSSDTVREVLVEAGGFLYDSSIIDDPWGDSVSVGLSARLWPYGMQDGIPQNCAEWAPYQMCSPEERYEGLFEVPVYDMSSTGLFSKDATDRRGKSVYTILQQLFDTAYEGNRAPVPLYVHTPWLTPDAAADVERFVDYALSKPDTYFVTMRQMLGWLQRPIPAASLTPEILGCGLPGGKAGSLDAVNSSSGSSGGGSSGSPPDPVGAHQAAWGGIQQSQQQPQQRAAPKTRQQPAAAKPSLSEPKQASQIPTAHSAGAAAAAAAAVVATMPSGGTSSHLGAIVGGALGGAAAAAAVVGAIIWAAHRRSVQAAGGSSKKRMWHAGRTAAGATAHISHADTPGSAMSQWKGHAGSADLARVVEQSGTPSSTRHRAQTVFNT